jgi:hypothetical protein
MYERIPMKNKSILPDEGFAARNVVISDDGLVMPVSCKPKPKPGEWWGHRVMVHCGCNREIPFGRMGQHWPKCTAR